MADALAEHLARPDPLEATAFVFSNTKGGPIRRTGWVRQVWNPAIKAVGLDGLTPHDLPHSHVAILIEQGEHPRAIADRLGHTSVRTVLDVYGHLFPDADTGIADRLDQRLAHPGVAQVWPKVATETGVEIPETPENPLRSGDLRSGR